MYLEVDGGGGEKKAKKNETESRKKVEDNSVRWFGWVGNNYDNTKQKKPVLSFVPWVFLLCPAVLSQIQQVPEL